MVIVLKEGVEYDNLVVIYNNFGNLYSDLGELEKVKEYFDRVLVICLKIRGFEDIIVVGFYSCFGNVYF